MTDTDRAEYIDGLKRLAHLLTIDPTALPLPTTGPQWPLSVFIRDHGLNAWAAALTDKKIEIVSGGEQRHRLRMTGRIGGVHLIVYADPEMLPKTVTGTRVVEDATYDYTGLLAERVS
jgi:hypothetical protein